MRQLQTVVIVVENKRWFNRCFIDLVSWPDFVSGLGLLPALKMPFEVDQKTH
jgi:hypothetical protein